MGRWVDGKLLTFPDWVLEGLEIIYIKSRYFVKIGHATIEGEKKRKAGIAATRIGGRIW